MEEIINEVKYYIPNNLTLEQKAIYVHIIDWKRKNITTDRGLYRGHEYDALFPEKSEVPQMMYKPIIPSLREIQKGHFAFKPHKFAWHAVSSQTACINLFMPMLLSEEADNILPLIPGCPSDFKKIARDRLHHGFSKQYFGPELLPLGYISIGEVHIPAFNINQYSNVEVKLTPTWVVIDPGMGKSVPTIPGTLNTIPLQLIKSKTYRIK